MRIHWYFPYSYGDARTVFEASRPGDEVVVQALATRLGRPLGSTGPFEVVRNLPEANARDPHSRALFRAPSRLRLFTTRAFNRHRLVAARSFDVSCQVHLNHKVDAVALRLLARHASLVSFVHDVHPHETRLGHRVERALLCETYRQAGELIVFHEVLAELLVADFGIDRSRVHVVPIQVQLWDLEHRLPRTDGPLRLLFFGGLRQNKGVDVLCDALEALGERHDFELRFAGSGSGPRAVRVGTVAERFAHVHADIGFVPHGEMPALFDWADMLVLPYTSFASQSGVLRDAYGHGRPLLVSDVGALGPTVRDDGTGVVVPPSDVVALATAIDSLARQPDEVQRYTERVLTVRQLHGGDVVGPQVRAIFDAALARM